MKVSDIEERLLALGTYWDAVMLLPNSGTAAHVEGLRKSPHYRRKLFHSVVLPEFATWLRSREGLRLNV